MPFNKKCRIGSVTWPLPNSYALIISIETESEFIAEYYSFQSVTFQLARGRKNPIDTAYDGISNRRLNGRQLLISVWASRLLQISFDTTECLEGSKSRRIDSSDVYGGDGAALMIA
ncbi:hypothetical protein TNCV_1036791 [Trichonephila clavipes]|nr:hypothetical protein TNCV_1036791 [Trichonephila clavipes]